MKTLKLGSLGVIYFEVLTHREEIRDGPPLLGTDKGPDTGVVDPRTSVWPLLLRDLKGGQPLVRNVVC